MQDANKYNSLYNGYRLLLSASVTLFVAAGIFTHILRRIIQGISAILIIAFLVGIIVNADRMKLFGWQKKNILFKLLLIPLFAGYLLLMLTDLPLLLKSILSGTITTVTLLIVKPSKKKGTMQ